MATFAAMKVKALHITKWFLTILFVSYVSGITLFTHSHIVDANTIVHSHPFQKSDHTHSSEQLILLHQLFHTHLTSTVVPQFDLTQKPNHGIIIHLHYFGLTPQLPLVNKRSTRAPPIAA